MKLFEISPKTGFSGRPNDNRYRLNKGASVEVQGEQPKDLEQGEWEFSDDNGFVQKDRGPFRQSVLRVTNSHRQMLSSSYSHTLKVKRTSV